MEQTGKVLTKHFLVGICQFRQIEMFCWDTGIFPWFPQKPGSRGATLGLGLQKPKGAALEQVHQQQPSREIPLPYPGSRDLSTHRTNALGKPRGWPAPTLKLHCLSQIIMKRLAFVTNWNKPKFRNTQILCESQLVLSAKLKLWPHTSHV